MIQQIRNSPGLSSYFQGRYRGYGRYQWDIKFYSFQDESEIETAQTWAFGEYSFKTGSFEGLNELLGRTIKASIQGRSAGWLVIDSELSEDELKKIDAHVESCLKNLPQFLKDERAYHADMEAASRVAEIKLKEDLETDLRVVEAIDLIRDVAGPDFILSIKGIMLGGAE